MLAGARSLMLALLFALPCMLLASLLPTASRLHAETDLPRDIWLAIVENLGIAGLAGSYPVSRDFYALARRTFLSFYGIEHGGRIYPHLAKLVRRFDALVEGALNASESGDPEEVCQILDSSQEYVAVKALLESTFGYCICHEEEALPTFSLDSFCLDLLNDTGKVSVVPYILGSLDTRSSYWGHFIHGLAERGRQDLLEQVRFRKVSFNDVLLLVAAKVSKSTIDSVLASPAAQLLGKAERDLLALAGYGDLPAGAHFDCKLPVAVIWSSQQNGLALPEHWLPCDGLSLAAIPFWMDLIENGRTEWFKLLQANGDAEIQTVLRSLTGPANIPVVSEEERDVYQAILIHIRFSNMVNQQVIENYEAMLGQNALGFHSLCALLDCKALDVIGRLDRRRLKWNYADQIAFVDRLYRSGNVQLVSLFADAVVRTAPGVIFVESLILRKADKAYIQIFLDAIVKHPEDSVLKRCLCAPLSVLTCFASDCELSIAKIDEMLAGIMGYSFRDEQVSQELHTVHMLLFWKAPEAVIAHYMQRLPDKELIDPMLVTRAVRAKRYSDDFVVDCGERCETVDDVEREISEFRPSLAKKLCCRDN